MAQKKDPSPVQVVTGKGPEIISEFSRPEIMAVRWSGAWSDASQEFMNSLAHHRRYKEQTEWMPLSQVPEIAVAPNTGALAFQQDLARLTKVLTTLGADLTANHGIRTKLNDFSRIEPAAGDAFTESVSDKHVDGGLIALVSPLLGETNYLRSRVPGYVRGAYFYPENKAQAAQETDSLTGGDVVVFKCRDYPFENPHDHGLVHWRGKPATETAGNGAIIPLARPLALLKLSAKP